MGMRSEPTPPSAQSCNAGLGSSRHPLFLLLLCTHSARLVRSSTVLSKPKEATPHNLHLKLRKEQPIAYLTRKLGYYLFSFHDLSFSLYAGSTSSLSKTLTCVSRFYEALTHPKRFLKFLCSHTQIQNH